MTKNALSAVPQVSAGALDKSCSLHGVGVLCALCAGVWLGAAEAPTKLVDTGLSPYAISLCMVLGVFTARWSIPTLLKGTRSVFADLRDNQQLIPFAILAGMLWAVANTLTVFAIRDVGLAIAFPLWNANSLIGIFWGRVLFGELKGAGRANSAKVLLGSAAIVLAAVLLGFSTIHGASHGSHAAFGIITALGASLLWGTMYVPYRKAYLSGMSPLSFVTIFTVGELVTMIVLVFVFDGGTHAAVWKYRAMAPVLFWLFLGGFIWVIGDLFQQFATKYVGIGRGIPLSNTNQLWGLAWGALVFGELRQADSAHKLLVITGSAIMIAGALAVSTAVASERERESADAAIARECARYSLDVARVRRTITGDAAEVESRRAWWDWLIVAAGLLVFAILAIHAQRPALSIHLAWTVVLALLLVVSAVVGTLALTRIGRARVHGSGEYETPGR